MRICAITATKDRHQHLERVVRFMMDQTYQDWIHVIYNNADTPLKLSPELGGGHFILINNNLDLKTGKPYETLGDIYNDILTFLPPADLVTFVDDDDVFLPNHLEEGVKGYLRGGKKAYKPQKSWFRHGAGIDLSENTLEPSIFVELSHIKQYGFSPETTAQHIHWLNPLIIAGEIFVDPEGPPTYICDWSQQIPTYKTSGDPTNPLNFQNYSKWSKDHGDGIITPVSSSWAEHYCKTK